MSPPQSPLEPPYLFAFLRAVNLGQHNKVPMKPLIAALERQGPPPTAYLLASGNLVFGSTKRATKTLRGRLEGLIGDEFGVNTAVVLRTAAEVQAVLAANPFAVPLGGSVHVCLWNVDERVDEDARRALQAADFGADSVALDGAAAYLCFAAMSHTSRLSNQAIERRLGVTATARNINTFERLLQRWPPAENSR
ncbi:MAG TPA: DUF1697 domain-containing protein [Trueperaceae bacterium]|nr:DUF1697 domain-containing protein [Trueperaceae bacterium]